jgi:hypothetical protein
MSAQNHEADDERVDEALPDELGSWRGCPYLPHLGEK